MEIITILLIAIGLAMDALSVSITSGITIKEIKLVDALKIGGAFGLFQFIMPLIGWFVGSSLRWLISGIDHWVAFGLLTFIGSKMIYESIKEDPDKKKIDPRHSSTLLILAISTSIDALAVGIGFSILNIVILYSAVIIGVVTFLLSFFGVFVGNGLRHLLEKAKTEMIGGIILIGIGTKILIEHLTRSNLKI
ncbi:MAG: manganese efflux pump MntP family protein [bacterium]